MQYDSDNIFAKILRGEAPAFKVDEDDFTLTFMDIMPQVNGHTLVIPKEPAIDIFDISEEALKRVIVQTQRIAVAVDQALKPDGVSVTQLNRNAAGQTIFHLHFHVIPRWNKSELDSHETNQRSSENLKNNAQLIRKELINIDLIA